MPLPEPRAKHDVAQSPGPKQCLVLIAKEPLPGVAKTRLAAGVGRDRAAQLGDGFLHDTSRTCQAVCAAGDIELCISMGAETSREYFRALAAEARLAVQPQGDFGTRLRAAFEAGFRAGAERVVLIGSDTPQLRSERVDAAFAALRPGAAVIGPAFDGGYYLLGLCEPYPELFEDIAWSTADVLRQTEARVRALGLELTKLPAMLDIDTVDDLDQLSALLAADRALCPATRELLGT